MGVWDSVQRFFALETVRPAAPPLQTRQVAGSLEDFAWSILGNSARREWRLPTISEALGVPSVLNAVTKISNITGTLSVEVLRNGQRIDSPPVIRRPNPLTTPGDFYRDVAYSLAIYGEAWLLIAKRDTDGTALALVPLNPSRVVVDRSRHIIRYLDQEYRETDVIQITYLREIGAERGKGPLQMAGAALSVAVEAQEWAANFYADGGNPSVLIKHASELDPTPDIDGYSEAERLRRQWVDRPNNVPRVIDQNIEDVKYFEPNEAGAQMLQSRMYQNGEVANMFGIPGPLLEYSAQGSSLTYQNIADLMRQFVMTCLVPNYLEKIEQSLSDLLPRNQVAHFDTQGLLRADIKTQYDVATLGFEKGIIDRVEARAIVGMEPSIEVAPVPFSPPRAIPNFRMAEPLRCECGHARMIVYDGEPPTVRCVNCKKERAIA